MRLRHPPASGGQDLYPRHIGVNSRSVLQVFLDRPAAKLLADIGLDRNVDRTAASATMHVRAGGKDLFATPVLRPEGKVQSIDVPLGGATAIDLVVNDGGDGRGWDQADWADARVVLEDGSEIWLDDLARGCGLEPGLPFSFVFGGRPSAEQFGGWSRSVREEALAAGGAEASRATGVGDQPLRLLRALRIHATQSQKSEMQIAAAEESLQKHPHSRREGAEALPVSLIPEAKEVLKGIFRDLLQGIGGGTGPVARGPGRKRSRHGKDPWESRGIRAPSRSRAQAASSGERGGSAGRS